MALAELESPRGPAKRKLAWHVGGNTRDSLRLWGAYAVWIIIYVLGSVFAARALQRWA